MTQWQKTKIEDFLTQRKERIVISSFPHTAWNESNGESLAFSTCLPHAFPNEKIKKQQRQASISSFPRCAWECIPQIQSFEVSKSLVQSK